MKRNYCPPMSGDTDVDYPAEIDETQYFVFKDSFTNKVSQRITLEEGQVLEVKPWSNDPTLELAIEKAGGLFMD